jgi:hypothetical protein
VTVVAAEVVAISVAVAADGAVQETTKTTALVVGALVTSTHHAQHQSRNREAQMEFYKILRTH